MNILMYCQHLSGTGHYVRTFQLASKLASRHMVAVTSGGREVPRRNPENNLSVISLPGIYRDTSGIASIEHGRELKDVWQERKIILLNYVLEHVPDILSVEHFPFSKHEIRDEIITLIETVRSANPEAKIICSLRDIIVHTKFDPSAQLHAKVTIDTLHEYFDSVFIHADPSLVKLNKFLPWADDISIPISYTGYISELPDSHSVNKDMMGDYTVVSVGGNDGVTIINHCIALWQSRDFIDISNRIKLIIFLPLNISDKEVEELHHKIGAANISIRQFNTSFINYLESAIFSISQAGYNTCVNLLQTQTKSILVPDPAMSDQIIRAKLLEKNGTARVVTEDELTLQKFMDTVRELIASPVPQHQINLEGDIKTMELIESQNT